MALPPSFLDELKARVPLATVIGRRVRLIRNGRNYKACCPFHNEKTPSFHVFEDHYHCFGCGAHGDQISFEMAAGGMSFMEAVEALAAEAGLEVPRPDPATRVREQHTASLQDVMEAACAFFEQRLRAPEGAAALAYLRRRGLRDDVIGRFRLGYAPPGGALRAHMIRAGMADEPTLVEVGLMGRPDDGRAPYETFRDRVLFPITDRRGRVVSFGGRVLGDGQPKYLNGPETPLFSKGRTLYGLAQAQEAIRATGEVIVAEGYMDVIALASGGFAQAVAPLGTALTEEQIDRVWALVPEPVLCFDGDSAGQRAAARALERALPRLAPGRSLRFALLPGGRDPDDLLREQGPSAMRAVLDGAVPMVELCWRTLRARHSMDTPERRAALEQDIERTVQTIEDRSVSQQYRGALRDRFWTEIKASRGQGGRNQEGGTRGGWRGAGSNRFGMRARGRHQVGDSGMAMPPLALSLPPPPTRQHEAVLLATVLNHPHILDQVAERLGTMVFGDSRLDSLRREILSTYRASVGAGDRLDRDALVNHLNANGLDGVVGCVLGPQVCMHASFARIHASSEAALAGWDHIYALHGQAVFDQDLRAAEERLASDFSDEALARVHTIRKGRLAPFDQVEVGGTPESWGAQSGRTEGREPRRRDVKPSASTDGESKGPESEWPDPEWPDSEEPGYGVPDDLDDPDPHV